MLPRLVFVMGATNAGKSSLLSEIQSVGQPEISFVEVGKCLRKKYLDPESPHYDPDYFKGSAAPTHTEKEAYSLMAGIIAESVEMGKSLVCVDGQPRTISQLEKVLYDYVEYPKSFVHVFATRHERVIRAIKRDAGNQAKLKLSMDRMDGDIPVIYEIDTLLRCAGEDVEIVNTGAADFSMASAVGSLLNAWSRNTGYLKAA